MVILPEHKAVFVSTPKCATNTMYRVLTGPPFNGIRQGPHFHNRDVPTECRDWFTFSIVRDPYSRAVSIWWRTIHDTTARRIFRDSAPHDLAGFVRWLTARPLEAKSRRLCDSQSEWLRPVRLDRTLALEGLFLGLLTLPFWRAGVDVPHSNQCKGRPDWVQYMTDDAVAAINEWANEDFYTFGYPRKLGVAA